MKNYINTILICSLLLLVFPFLGFPELWENLYIILLGCVIGLSVLYLKHKSGLIKITDADASLEEYVQELQEKFKLKKEDPKKIDTLSAVHTSDDE